MASTLAALNEVLLVVLAIVVTAFPIIYGVLAPFWKTLLGRSVMILGVALALLADLSILFDFWQPSPVATQLIIMVVLLLIIIGSLGKDVAIIKTQLRGRKERTGGDTNDTAS